jgi:hypothetical protein
MRDLMSCLRRATLAWVASTPWAAVNAQAIQVPEFGQLPDTPLSQTITSGVRAEICQQHLIAANVRTRSLPAGFRLLTVADRASTSKQFRDLLLERPEYATYGFGSLCFLEAESVVVNGMPVRASGLLLSAFWWAAVVPTDSAPPRDPRVRGTTRHAQLASWYAAEVIDRALITASDPMAEYAPVEITSLGHRHWRVALSLPNGKVEGEIRGKGDRTKMYPGSEVRFMTVASTGEHAKYFTVYSYYGHYGESASGEWSSLGEAPVALAAKHTGAALGLNTEVQDSWRSLSGVYQSGR